MLRSCIIIEDQPPAQRILKKYITDIGSLNLKATFSNAIDAIPFLQLNTIDLIFLDIHLPKISGIDFLKTLKNSPQIILTTAFSEYAIQSYEHNVVDYLLKPFSFQRFVQAIAKSLAIKETIFKIETPNIEKNNTSLIIKSGHEFIKVNTTNIIYIKSDDDYTEIITDNKKHLSNYSLKIWLTKLETSFCQVHKSYIINTTRLQKISGNQIFLDCEKVIPIGRAYKDIFFKSYLN